MTVKGWGQTDMGETLDQYEQDMLGGAGFFKFKDGDNEVRILPPAPGERKPFFKRAQHWRVGEAERIFNCPKAIDDTVTCFVHDQAAALKKSDDKADIAKGEDLYAKNQWLYRVLDFSTEASLKKGVQVMAVGKQAHSQIAKLMKDKEYGDITDPEDGINITIDKSGSGQYTTDYTVRPKRSSTNIVKYLEGTEPTDLAALCEVATNKQMKAAWDNEEAGAGPKPAPEQARRRDVDDDNADDNAPPPSEPTAKRAREDDEPEARPTGRHLATAARRGEGD